MAVPPSPLASLCTSPSWQWYWPLQPSFAQVTLRTYISEHVLPLYCFKELSYVQTYTHFLLFPQCRADLSLRRSVHYVSLPEWRQQEQKQGWRWRGGGGGGASAVEEVTRRLSHWKVCLPSTLRGVSGQKVAADNLIRQWPCSTKSFTWLVNLSNVSPRRDWAAE